MKHLISISKREAQSAVVSICDISMRRLVMHYVLQPSTIKQPRGLWRSSALAPRLVGRLLLVPQNFLVIIIMRWGLLELITYKLVEMFHYLELGRIPWLSKKNELRFNKSGDMYTHVLAHRLLYTQTLLLLSLWGLSKAYCLTQSLTLTITTPTNSWP